MNGIGRADSDALTNLALGILVMFVFLTGVLRLAGSITAFLTGTRQPTVGPVAGLGVLIRPCDPGVPLGASGLSAVAYWGVVAIMLTLAVAAGWWVWRLIGTHQQNTAMDPRRLAGTATSAEIVRAASARTLTKRAETLRPSLSRASASDVGYRLGTSKGKPVWATVEDSILLIGPPRSGKGLHIVINAILDAPGAVVTTSTRPDNIATTLKAREKAGPVAVFDPQQLAPGLPVGLRWSPVRGCDDPLTAMIRATGLASSLANLAAYVEE